MSKKQDAKWYIRQNGATWMMLIDVQDMTGLSREVVRQAVVELSNDGVLETKMEGRYICFRLKEWYRKQFIDVSENVNQP